MWDKLFKLSEFQLPHLLNGENIDLVVLLEELKERYYSKCANKCLLSSENGAPSTDLAEEVDLSIILSSQP